MKAKSAAAGVFTRWGLLFTALIAAAALCATALVGYRSTGELFASAGAGQAEAFFRSLRREMERGPVTTDAMEEFLSDNEDLGLRYAAFLDIDGEVAASGGKPLGEGVSLPEDPRTPLLETVGERLRFTSLIPMRYGRMMNPGRMPMRGMDPRHEEATDLRRAPRVLVLEFEPVLWRKSRLRATLSLAVSIAASALLLASAVVFWRMNKRAEESRAEMENQRQLASLGVMSAVLAHEIKNPLAVLKGHAQLLEEALGEGEAAKRKARVVVGEAERLEKLINELLEFVRTGEVSIKDENPAEILAEAVRLAGDDSMITIDALSSPPGWPLDGPRIERALANLLANAVQASPEGLKAKARILIEGENLVFEVTDHGPGIPKGDEERIFEPFRTGRAKGVGLGLAVARKTANAHGGEITAANGPADGAVFRMVIPRRTTSG